ncbi:MAG: leucine-rich repeat protein [Clostridia bacterium]|nr:leucine-rich repeat protein [Clostridia bacterium]
MSKKTNNTEEPVILNIPDDEIWTYQVEGLAPPRINKPYRHFTLKKIIFALTIIVAVSVSCWFSVQTIQTDTFKYNSTENGYELTKFSNTGNITVLDIDFVSDIEYESDNPDVMSNFKIKKDTSKKVTSVGKYALNCDEKIKVITIGKDVTDIDPKAFYSCYALQRFDVDENNPNYCSVDGVLYTKDMKRIICHPCDHDAFLAEQFGFTQYDENGVPTEPDVNSKEYDRYVEQVLTFVVPSSVETIGELCFNYANIKNVYLPEGLKTVETLGFFKMTQLSSIYSYKGEAEVSRFESEEALGEVYVSLPDGLYFIGSDAFSYNQSLSYMYIPKSVTYIGHHAFWDTVYKQDNSLAGVTAINAEASAEAFEAVQTGNNWRPQYDYLLFKKSVDIIYNAKRGTE